MAVTKEGAIKKKLDEMLKGEKVWFYSPQAGPHGVSGIPDRVCCIDGLFVGIECKADARCAMTALQKKCARDIIVAGGVHFLVYDMITIGQVREFIRTVRATTELKQRMGITHVGRPAEQSPGT